VEISQYKQRYPTEEAADLISLTAPKRQSPPATLQPTFSGSPEWHRYLPLMLGLQALTIISVLLSPYALSKDTPHVQTCAPAEANTNWGGLFLRTLVGVLAVIPVVVACTAR
jgi:hypothetical protein